MGTKLNPGQFDCYAKAEPNEPYFTLVGRDPLAGPLVELWAHLRARDFYQAALVFGYLVAMAAKVEPKPNAAAKIEEAKRCAMSLRDWCLGLRA